MALGLLKRLTGSIIDRGFSLRAGYCRARDGGPRLHDRSADGASQPSLGASPQVAGRVDNTSAESATQHNVGMNRAFSAGLWVTPKPGALPQARHELRLWRMTRNRKAGEADTAARCPCQSNQQQLTTPREGRTTLAGRWDQVRGHTGGLEGGGAVGRIAPHHFAA